jgi:hypothetical protein
MGKAIIKRPAAREYLSHRDEKKAVLDVLDLIQVIVNLM